MHKRDPRMQKFPSMGKKSFHFSSSGNDETDQENFHRKSIVEQKLKRQNQYFQTQRPEKIVKKHKIDENQHSIHEMKKDSQANCNDFVHINLKSPKVQQTPQQIQQKSLQLLEEMLLSSDCKDKSPIINPQVANKWILSAQTPIKIKSFLILYMILYQFKNVEFGFKKSFNIRDLSKKIDIFKIQDKLIFHEGINFDQNYQANQFKKYLIDYLQWLIDLYEDKFEAEPKYTQFFNLALNKCEQASIRLLRSTSQKQKDKKATLVPFFMNVEDFVSRSVSPYRISISNKLSQEDISIMPVCHWILALNFSLKYFYNKRLDDRVRNSLENINPNQTKDFYHQHMLFSGFFMEQIKHSEETQLSDWILEWLAFNSHCKGQIGVDTVLRYKLTKQICKYLVQKGLQDCNQAQSRILLTIKLLSNDSLQEKNKVISQILYGEQKAAYRLGSTFPQVLNKLEYGEQPLNSQFFKKIVDQYKNFYSHLILSEHKSIKHDLLAQFKHLIQINFEKLKPQIKHRIRKILSSFHLLTHWNKDVLKKFVFILDQYIQKFSEFLRHNNEMMMEPQGDQIKKEKTQDEKELIEFQSLCIFLKVHLNLEPLNLQKLAKVIDFIKKPQILPFEQKTITFLKKDMLSILFAKNGLHKALLLQMKKSHSENQGKREQEIDTKSSKKNILIDLKEISQSVRYAQDQIELLLIQAENLQISDN